MLIRSTGSDWARLWDAFDIQRHVIGALIIRELHTRYGRDNIGYLWMLAEPVLLAGAVASLHAGDSAAHYGSDFRPIPFAITGYCVFMIFRSIVSRAETALEANKPLLFHRVVTIFDMLAARALLEFVSTKRPVWLHPIVLFVLLPTLLVAAFEYLVVADQYVSEAHFIVRSPQSTSSVSGIGQMLGIGGSPVQADAHSVGDYLLSHDAVAALGRRIDLPATFRRPEADPFTRLRQADPPPETLLKYYRGQVGVDFDTETGITTLSARAFRPSDAKRLAQDLLELGERRVNSLNLRMLENGLAVAESRVNDASQQVASAQSALTAFRQSRRDVDPDRSASAQIQMATQLRAQAAQARAQLNAMAAVLSPSAPQYVALARQVAALEAQVGAAQSSLAGSERSVASSLGQFEELRLRQEFAAKRYEAASATLEAAREQLLRQQLFIVRVVEPNMPEKSLYPKRLKILASVFFGLLLAYAIGWLILAGVREHQS